MTAAGRRHCSWGEMITSPTLLFHALRDFLGECLAADTRKAILDRVEHSAPGSCLGADEREPTGLMKEDDPCAEARAYAKGLTKVLPRGEARKVVEMERP